jgi:hypothetical protein
LYSILERQHDDDYDDDDDDDDDDGLVVAITNIFLYILYLFFAHKNVTKEFFPPTYYCDFFYCGARFFILYAKITHKRNENV